MAITRKRPIPPVPTKTPQEIRPFLEALREQIQVTAGHGRGNTLDRAVTFRDLNSVEFREGVNRAVLGSGGALEGGDPPGYDFPVENPTQPTNFRASASDTMVVVAWDAPNFDGYWYTQVYRTTWDGTNIPGFSETYAYSQTVGNLADVTVNQDTDYYYWAKHVNLNGVKSVLSVGAPVKTLKSLDLQDGWVTTPMLEAALASRVDLIDTTEVLAGIPGLDGAVAALDTEQQAQGGRITTVESTSSDHATRLASLGTWDGTNYSRILTIESTQSTHATRLSSLGTWDGSNYSKIVNLESTTATNASSITQVTTDLNSVETRLTTNENEAFYSVKVDANGNVAGWGLTATPTSSAILFSAEQIGFQNSAGSDILPFSIRDNVVYISTAKIEQVEATRIINVESVNDEEKFAQLGNTYIEGFLALAQPGQIQFKDLDPQFRDTLVRVDPAATTTGGSRSKFTTDPQLTSYYAAKEGGIAATGDEPISSGGASTLISVRVTGGISFAAGHPNHVTAPSITYNVKRRNINDNITETLLSGHVATGTATNVTAAGEPEEHWSSINDEHSFNATLPTNGKDYEYWVEVTAKSGSWSTSGTTGGSLTFSVQETLGSSGGVLVETLAYQGNPYFTVNDGGSGSGASLLTGDLFVNNFTTKVIDSTGKFFPTAFELVAGGSITSGFNAGSIITDDNNGDVTLAAAGAELNIGGTNTTWNQLTQNTYLLTGKSLYLDSGKDTRISQSGDVARITTPHGYVDVGPASTATCNLSTDRASFTLNKKLITTGSVEPSADSAHSLGASSLRWLSGYFDEIDTRRGINGSYGVSGGSGSNWGSTIWGIGPSYDGNDSGTAYAVTGVYGLSWLRGTHGSASSYIGEGLYIYQNGALQGGIGSSGIWAKEEMRAKSWGNGTSNAKVMTWEDFTYQDDPPVGLENVINASWIQAGAIRAHHVQVQSSGNETGNTSGVAIELNPFGSAPLNIRDKTTDKTVFSVQLEDGEAMAVVNGSAGENFVNKIKAITTDVRKALNKYYLGAGNTGSATTGSVASGGNKNFTITTTSAGIVQVNFTLKAFNHVSGGSSQNYTAPVWNVVVRRDSTTGTILYNKTHTGTATNVQDLEPGSPTYGTWFCSYNLDVEDFVYDEGAAVSTSEVYYIIVTRTSGTPTSVTVSFDGETPSFLENTLSTGTNGYFKDKDTGFCLQWGSGSYSGNSLNTVTFPISFDTFCAGVVTNPVLYDNDAMHGGKVTSKNVNNFSFNNAYNSTQTFTWFAYGY